MYSAKKTAVLFPTIFALLLMPLRPADAQFSDKPSFGNMLNKKQVMLKRKLAPLYDATGKTVAITIANGQLQSEVEIAFEKQLTQNDSTIHVGGENPDLIVELQISHFTEPKYAPVNENGVTTQHLVGDLSVLFRIANARNKSVVKSDTASSQLDQVVSRTSNPSPAGKVFGIKIPANNKPATVNTKGTYNSPQEAHLGMVSQVASEIAMYLVSTQETVDVPLAVGGPLNEPNKLAGGGLWSRNLESLETLTPFPDPKLEAYRLYNLGVANEALAYQTMDTDSALKYLKKASTDYGEALDTHPEEKYFLDPQNRIKTALNHYEELARLEKAPPPAPPKAEPPAPSANTASAPDGTITDQDVIDMVKNHIDEANILDTIQHAPAVNFDLGPQGQIKLTQGGVNGKLLLAMKQRARATPTSTVKSARR